MELDRLIHEFRSAALEKATALQEGDSSRDKALHKRMTVAVKALYAAGPEGRTAFAALLKDKAPEVAAWAAAELLAQGDVSSIPVLERIAEEPGLVGLAAAMTLREHARDRLSSPFRSNV